MCRVSCNIDVLYRGDGVPLVWSVVANKAVRTRDFAGDKDDRGKRDEGIEAWIRMSTFDLSP